MLARHNAVWLVPRYGAPAKASVVGVLDRATYPQLRDRLLEFAADAEDGVLIDVERLDLRDRTLIRVFALVALRVGEWPAIPFALVTGRPEQRAALAGCGVPVYPDAATAEAALISPARRRAGRLLDRSPRTSARARGFVRGVCAEWMVPELAEDAELIATELVENTLRHTDSAPRLRLELRRRTLSVEVSDESRRPAVLREGLDLAAAGLGLRMITKVAKRWGSSRSRSGGKTVWALLAR
ncbi:MULTISPECIES: ATP-binding protein [unclassified Amycolatopsis]|uniref:ATP-binding protein n=1 Tax=unclassified Amycolatopsis TaxID=2618356 RepID=UPI002876FD28|nr:MULTISPECIES: ATP-binding protein [unclassified Amycolatopsis]MDS0138699.1 ATP-binding protein [Amycolatopsis sp. 505]MDS0147193.1 ATP-binding protein [Amycolatopsis sp. CM201R]